MSDALNMLAECDGSSNDEASLKICGFLQTDDLPELDNRPRIILAAGSMDDQELTSSVLWLRGFNVDITCVELAPYRIPESGKVILVPRVVIPIPEARDFLINVERKEVAQVQRNKDKSKYASLWRAVADEFNVMNTPLTASGRVSGSLMRANIRHPYVHYEWVVRRSEGKLDVALHFESKDRDQNQVWLQTIKEQEAQIKQGMVFEFEAHPWGRKWAEVRFRIPLGESQAIPEVAHTAASVMKSLVERTYPILQSEGLVDQQ
jgi:hypothetical protein